MTFQDTMQFGVFMAPFHPLGENPTLALERDLRLIETLDELGYDEVWVGEHHSAGWELIASPEVFIATAAARTKRIRLGTGVVSLPYHHPLMVAGRMVLLDHLTRGRVMFGVGPGALPSDALMIGIEPNMLRPRMAEALRVILRLLTEPDPISHESEWFTLRNERLQLRPFTRPHMPIAVTAVASPSGMIAAGEHGAGVLTMSVPRGQDASALAGFWQIAEDTAGQHGRTVDRAQWRLALHVHLADTRQEALRQVQQRAGRYRVDYYEGALGFHPDSGLSVDDAASHLAAQGDWCIGTPDDLIDKIRELQQHTGGFGTLLVQAIDWADTEHLHHSYELLARYVIPAFQGSTVGLCASFEAVSAATRDLAALRTAATEQSQREYTARA